MGNKRGNKILKTIIIVVAILLLFDLALVGIFFIPAVQTFVVHKVTDSISEKWGTELSIGKIRLTPTLKLVAHDVNIKDHHDEKMIYSAKVKGRLRNFRTKPFTIGLRDVEFENAEVILRTYKGEDDINIAKWSEKFASDEPSGTFILTSNSVKIKDGYFVLINDNDRIVFNTDGNPDIDYAFLELANLNIDADDFKLVNSDIYMKFNDLSFTQYSGFNLKHCSGDFRICDTTLVFDNLKLTANRSNLDLDLKFRYDNWKTYAEFIDSVIIEASIRPSVLSMSDVACFAPAINGMNEIFNIEAQKVSGVVSDFSLKGIDVEWLCNSRICGDIAIRDVINFKDAVFDVKLDSLLVYIPDLQLFTLPGGKTIPLNSTIMKLGNSNLSGTFSGTLADGNLDVKARTGIGTVNAKIETATDSKSWTFVGDISSPDINLAKLTGNGKTIGKCGFNAIIDGKTDNFSFTKENFRSLDAHLHGNVTSLQLLGYPLRDITVDGDYAENLYNLTINANDQEIKGKAIAQLDLTQETPFLQGSASFEKLALGNIASKLPLRDSATAKGIDKFIGILQNNPSVNVSLDHFQVAMHGNNFDNFNGFIGCDNIRLLYNEDSLKNERLRITALNNNNLHKYILSSNIANATFETSYPINSVKDSLQSIAHNFLPSIVNSVANHSDKNSDSGGDKNGFIKLNLRTYNTRPITNLLMPDMVISPNTTANIEIYEDSREDIVNIGVPFFMLRNKLRVFNATLNGKSDGNEKLDLSLTGDSLIVFMGKGRLLFDNIDMNADVADNIFSYNLLWHNPFNSKENISQLTGNANILNTDDVIVHLQPSKIFLKDIECHFNDSNSVHIRPNVYLIDNLTFSTHNSELTLNGDFKTKEDSRLTMAIKNMDMSLLNPLLNNMTFDGFLSANLNLLNRDNKKLILGKSFIEELSMNNSRLGDLFVIAGMNDEGNMRFSGGLYNSEQLLNYDYLNKYSINDFKDEKNVIANITGTYENKLFEAHALFDTLQADFLSPFLSSFSDKLTGTASGDLAFYASPDSTYFDGTVHVIDAKLGIAALGTEYQVKGQDIGFNRQGFTFNNMKILDKDGNDAYLSGDILHEKFDDMQLELQIHTDKILALDAPRTTNSLFYGTGYVSGDAFIFGTSDNLTFVGPNIKTLEGSRIVLQVSSVNSAAETDLIHFTTNTENIAQIEKSSSTALNFDFTFDVTNDADVVLLLESIGGTLNARADGRFQLSYTNDELNLYGNLLLHSGDFKISLYDVVNAKFTLQQGGSINFDGPLDDMTVDIGAYKTSKTSLSNIIPAEYLSSGNVNVNAWLRLQGPLMQRIEPTFSFELPNSSSEVRNLFYTAIDTQNTENMTKQFAYFLITNSFMPENMFSNNTTGSYIGSSGISLFSNIVNSMLSNVIDSKVGSFGLTYNQATETSSAEYGVKANANLLKDRVTMSTSIGYYDDRTAADAYNNIYGDFSVEYNINKSGTWRLKAYTYIGERDDDYFYENNFNNYTAGVALAYKQDFDTKRRNKKQKKSIKTDNEQQQ